VLRAVRASSASDVWAVGFKHAGDQNRPLIERWDGNDLRAGSLSGLPQNASVSLNDVAVLAPDDAWVAGDVRTSDKRDSGLLAHWNGSSWSLAPSVQLPVKRHVSDTGYQSLLAITRDDVWAIEQAFVGHASPLFAVHWDGSSWRAFRLPVEMFVSNSEILDMSAVSSRYIWAVGDVYEGGGSGVEIMLRWDGSRWRNVVPADTGCYNEPGFTGVAAVTSSEAWAVGADNNCGLFVERWNGRRWRVGTRRGLPVRSMLYDLELQSQDVWAFGTVWARGYSKPARPLLARWTGGRWTQLRTQTLASTTPSFVQGAVVTPTDIWAIGSERSGASNTIARYNCA
jgi:hypothetical protein